MTKTHMNYITIAMLLAVLIAFLWPEAGYVIRPYISYLLIGIMLVSLLGVKLGKIIHIPKKMLLFAFVIQYFILPAAGWVLVYLFVSDPAYATGLILGLVMPVGITAPALAKLMGGNFEESLAYTMLFTILAIVVSPLMFWLMAGIYIKVDPITLIKPIAMFVIIPFILAKVLERFMDVEKVHKYTSQAAIVLLFFIILGVASEGVGQIVENFGTAVYFLIFVLLVIFVLIAVAALASRLIHKKADEVSLILLTWKNFTLAIVLASTVPILAKDPNIAFAVVVFAIMTNVAIAIFTKFLEKFRSFVLG